MRVTTTVTLGAMRAQRLDSMYNCFKLDDISTRTGFTKLGVERVGALMTRAVMIDVAALKGVDMLADTYEITVQDLQQALTAQKLAVQPGDAVIIHTGWGNCGARTTRAFKKAVPVSESRRPNG